MSPVNDDVCSHQNRIGEQSGIDIFLMLADLLFESSHLFQLSL